MTNLKLTKRDITFFAKTNFRNEYKRFGIKREDRRRHIYIVGKTGMGKTNLLETMAISDIQSGKGVCILDPHGEFAEKILDYVPRQRINDVLYFNPADLDYPISFNLFEKVEPRYQHLVASGIGLPAPTVRKFTLAYYTQCYPLSNTIRKIGSI